MTGIRRLDPADAPAYGAFRLGALARHPAAFTSSAEEERARLPSWAAARIHDPARPDDFVLGAFEGSRLVGTAGFRRGARPKERHKGTLFGMAVAPEAAGRGIGGRLVDRLVAEARAIPGLLQLDLTVSEGGAAERLYAARGFAVFGREPRAIVVGGVPVAKKHMVLMLDAPAAGGSLRPTLVLGGARSGKSRHAEALARAAGLARVYLATATAGDDEMRGRIAAHRAARAADGWRTVEEPLALADALRREAAPGRVVLVDCLTLWLANVMLGAPADGARDAAAAATAGLAAALEGLAGPAVFVSNEVGWGIVPDNRLARDFRDAQGRLNQSVAEACARVVLVAAGLPLVLKGGADQGVSCCC